MRFLPWVAFGRIVGRYDGDRHVRSLPCSQHFRTLAFAQITGRESLRDIEACLAAQPAKLYHSGFRQPVRRSTLADAGRRRDWRIYADLGQHLIARARPLHADHDPGLDLRDTVHALDSSTIDLCLSVFPWARFRSTKSAVKMHTLLDLRGSIPSFLHISDGKLHDVNVLDLLLPEPGAIYVMDRACVDFKRLHALHQSGAFFVTRAKKNLRARRVHSRPKDREQGIMADQAIALESPRSRDRYPDHLRRIRYKDPDTGTSLVFLTNRTDLDALTICALYKSRWQIELFFKWVKQHLRVKRFFGTSENAVKSQLWIAVSVYVLIAIIRKELKIETELRTMLQILSVMPFETMPLREAMTLDIARISTPVQSRQLSLFPDPSGS